MALPQIVAQTDKRSISSNTPRIVETFDYLQADGSPAYRVLRYEPKDFKQQHWDGSGWQWGLGPYKDNPLPWNLPDLKPAIIRGWTVFIVEGERKGKRLLAALQAAGAHAVVTCNNGGAGKWGEAQSEHLIRAIAVLLPDNDKAGHDHAIKAARHLHAALATQIKIVELPGLAEKEDIDDWLQAGHTVDELLTLVNSTPEYEPPAAYMTPAQLPSAPKRTVTPDDRRGLMAWAARALENITAEVASSGPGQHFAAMKAAANRLGTIAAHDLLTESECVAALEYACDKNGYTTKNGGQVATRKRIEFYFRSGLAHPEDCELPDPRDRHGLNGGQTAVIPTRPDIQLIWLSSSPVETFPVKIEPKNSTENSAPADGTRRIYNHPIVASKTLTQLLSTNDPVRALDRLPIQERSESTIRRRKARTLRTSIDCMDDPESETADDVMPSEVVINPAQSVSQRQIRQNRIRILFPQADPIAALLPAGELTPELFDGALTDDEVSALVGRLELTANEKTKVRQRLRTLKKVEQIERNLADDPFIPDSPIRNLPDLRAQLLRHIVKHCTDPDTGEAKLSNAVQACLLGVTPGALPGIRKRGGVEQIAPEPYEQKFASATRLPGNARSVRTVGGETVATIQPVARQHIVDLPQRQPKQDKQLLVPGPGAQQDHDRQTSPIGDKPARKPRRPAREHYAALLLRNILRRFDVPADASEPLVSLADKLRQVIRPADEHPGKALYEQYRALKEQNPDAAHKLYARPDFDRDAYIAYVKMLVDQQYGGAA